MSNGSTTAAPSASYTRERTGTRRDTRERTGTHGNARGRAHGLTEAALAYTECRTVQTVEAGDHWLLLAQVEGGETASRGALLYCRGAYGA
ncbi:flavin reductase family protein [Streptomyces sp. NPDC046985]|uniref:flavin reductase family protein n=1 Tax=Streptomyces sp. NPDC046985 TaxID=3155377 RepID=UPI0034053FCD